MIDPLLSLAFAINTSPGVFALLVGSGVSRAAKIPTGWDIVLDLTRKLAALHREDCGLHPEQWFEAKFGRAPEYTALLSDLAKSQAERQALLRGYFEPTEEERQDGLKQPTKAHRAIAELVSGGHVRVIVTTNFDRLLEQAIQDVGITPVVLASNDAVEGANPLSHQRCCILKVNGDYLDTRIRNTAGELERYDPATERLLQEILDNFGLVVCGWSAQWDTALKAAMERCPSRRFTWYWTARGDLTDEASRLAAHRDAQVIRIEDADSFLGKLGDLVRGLHDSRRVHPETIEAAVALEKRFLSEDRFRIQLDDLIHEESEQVRANLDAFNDVLLKDCEIAQDAEQWSRRYFELVERLLALIVQGCAHGKPEHDEIWIRCISRLAQPRDVAGPTINNSVRLYPVAVLYYGAGLAVTARKNDRLLSRLFLETKVRTSNGTDHVLLSVKWWDMGEYFPTDESGQMYHTPTSEHFFRVMREPLRRLIPDDGDFNEHFDRIEYIYSLVFADLFQRKGRSSSWYGPVGRFGWKHHNRNEPSIVKRIGDEAAAAGADWQLLKYGLFDGSLNRFKEVETGFCDHLAHPRFG